MLARLLREPLLHFVSAGALLFLLFGLSTDTIVEDSQRIEISKADIGRLSVLWQRKRQREPTEVELEGLINAHIREEVLYRTALEMGLDRNDTIVRRRLAQKVEFISSDLADQIAPSESALIAYLREYPKKFEIPGQISFTQVYFNTERRGDNAHSDAMRLLAELNQSNKVNGVLAAGDPFMLGEKHQAVTRQEVSRLFGGEFADKLFKLDTGGWHGPIVSGYGLHLVHIENKADTRQPALSEVRHKVSVEWAAQQRKNADDDFYSALRARYEIVVDSTDKSLGTLPQQ